MAGATWSTVPYAVVGGRNGAGASLYASCSANEERSGPGPARERTHPKCTPPANLHCARSGPWGGRSSHACTYASKGRQSPYVEISLGDFVGGELFTSALLCANGPSSPAWIRWGRDFLWGHIVNPRYGVMFNALRLQMPLPWSGQHIVLVPYTGIAWGRLPVAMQNELVLFGFPR